MLSQDSKFVYEGLTFDDVLVLPSYSEILPRDVSTQTNITSKVSLNIPLISAAMDTVTEAKMAISMAREGGLGIIHKNMSIAKQASQVRKVKRSESGMIKDPITLKGSAQLEDAVRLMRENSIGGIPVIDENTKLVGIITNRDLRFEKDLSKRVDQVMTIENLITAKEGTTLEQAELILQQYKIEKLPVVDNNFKLIGLITFKDIQKLRNFPLACKDKFGRLKVGAAVGIAEDTLDRVKSLVEEEVDVITLDTAHGHSFGVIEMLKKIKSNYSSLSVIAGNVATYEGAKLLRENGADAIKVGVGPGSICTTRIIAGIGVPQLSAIMEAKRALEGSNIGLIADGGIRYSGDIVKALVAGADAVMAGSIFAGSEEAPGETSIYNGRKVKSYRGMGSIEAMKKGSGDRYFQDPEEEISKLVPEGIVGSVPYKGSITEIVYQLVGGIKAGMGYCGSPDLQTLQKSKFTKISGSSIIESHPHDITITKEAPNYSR